MKNKVLSKLIVPHSDHCRSKHWSGVLDEKKPAFFGNYNANENAKRGNSHYWYRVLCNDPNCKGIKAVHSSVLADA
jgi:hypothetical protein